MAPRRFLTLLAVCLLAACAGPVERFTPVGFEDLPGWQADDLAEALPALRRSCALVARRDDDRPVGPKGAFGRNADWRPACAALADLPEPASERATRAVITEYFRAWRVTGPDGAEGLFTGYYEPSLDGALSRGGPYQTPLHGRPGDLVEVELGNFREDLAGRRVAGRVIEGRLRPYDDRAAIAANGLDAPVIAWVDDPVDAFFLHIQGSGRIALAGGGEMRVGYAGQNGHPYFPIGRALIERGALTRENVSLQTIRAWLLANPGEAAAVMGLNPSYVFFRALDTPGPVGAEGVVLTPGRSLAVDRTVLPYGAPVWLSVAHPLEPGTNIRRLMVAQDTGGAIRGVVRGDYFWGHGALAEEAAGKMRSRGRYWVLLPVGVTIRSADSQS